MTRGQEGYLTSFDYALDKESLKRSIANHVEYTRGADEVSVTPLDVYWAIARTVRDRMMDRWNKTRAERRATRPKRVYYLSMEFLLGRLLSNNLMNLGLTEPLSRAAAELGYPLEEVLREEQDAGLGNGGLGRLAACFLDSMATLGLAATGYGIRYEYGIFRQELVNGAQVERADNWLRYGSPWEIEKPSRLYLVGFGGHVSRATSPAGTDTYTWEPAENVIAIAHDVLIPGYRNGVVNTLRLWSAKAAREFSFADFNRGDYVQSLYDKNATENISRVLYPNDMVLQGRELRFRQEYFFVSATIQDALRRHLSHFSSLESLPEQAIFQLNDTHPVIAIAELLRLLLDEHHLPWEHAFGLVVRSFAYTNHTVMPEALELWEVSLFERLLPRHLQLIYEINWRFLEDLRQHGADPAKLSRMSLIEESSPKRVRMAHLALVGSSHVNGVSRLHTDILRQRLFADFYARAPERFSAKTNGITPRRWLLVANPELAEVITGVLGSGWERNLDALNGLAPLADHAPLQRAYREVKARNKLALSVLLGERHDVPVDPESVFDLQIKRIHEYKRQLLNVLGIVATYLRLKEQRFEGPPRTFILAGKAAPGYAMAKLIIELVNAVGRTIAQDPQARDQLRVVFVSDYSVSLAERLIPAADVSQQISLAGTEASGTSNMKFALNGALTLGTLDGANVEILEAVGRENIFIFGLSAEEVEATRQRGYSPESIWQQDAELARVLEAIEHGVFSAGDRKHFQPIVESLRYRDPYLVCADFRSYLSSQHSVGDAYLMADTWAKRAILNTAGMGRFSSDKVIAEYAREIWRINTP